ncbi:MAG: hypothetical protein IJ509_04035 [Bacilli bacterium]|nr:hypothetical protein [Bacilli bacterium]
MNKENLYYAKIKKIEDITKKPPITSYQDCIAVKKIGDNLYKDALSLRNKTYSTTYANNGDIFIDKLIEETNQQLSRRELKNKLHNLRTIISEEEQIIDTSRLYVGYIAEAKEVEYIDSPMGWIYSGTTYRFEIIKPALLYKKAAYTYIDTKTKKEYSSLPALEGDIFVPDDDNYLIPFYKYLDEDERCTNMPKKRVLKKYEEINK